MLSVRSLAAGAAALLGLTLTGTATAAPAAPAADCSVSGVAMNVSNYGGAAAFNAWCSTARWVTADLWFYNANGDPIAGGGGGVTKVDAKVWRTVNASYNIGTWMPITRGCIWVYQDSPPTTLLYSGCFPRNQ